MSENQENPTWQELHGSKNWQGLTSPLNLNLRKLILQCGDFCQATHDAFNNDKNSKFCGTSRYGTKSFFNKVMMDKDIESNFKVVSFFYATAKISVPEALLLKSHSREMWDRESNWIGYVAVSNDEVVEKSGRREIFVVWRGSTRSYEWVDDLDAELKSLKPLLPTKVLASTSEGGDKNSGSIDEDDENLPKVMQGWLTIYTSDDPKSPFTKTSARTQLLTIIQNLINRYKDDNLSITFTGHSLGACLSILSAFDIAENIKNISNIPISAFVFCSPQVGNKAFNEKLKKFTNVHVLCVRNTIDLIPHFPLKLWGYVYTGTELVVDTRKSPNLKDSNNPGDWHNLEAMLHIVAGWNGKDGEFELKVKRSLALVNKSCEYLKDEYLVPGVWWVEKNKGMIFDDNGDWVLTAPDKEDLPVPAQDIVDIELTGAIVDNEGTDTLTPLQWVAVCLVGVCGF